ncbi:hypothetical protein BDF22DRAFT_744317 [Syncephalis plumigaleata]|nr:hypothetical protein BDF22DRAFT_744317 [Syncephalis plumigaleata]
MFRSLRRTRAKTPSMLSYAKVEVMEDRSYRPGETVHGKLTLQLAEPTAIQEIYVALLGIADNATHRSVGISGPRASNESNANGNEQTANATTNTNTNTNTEISNCTPQPISRNASQMSYKSSDDNEDGRVFMAEEYYEINDEIIESTLEPIDDVTDNNNNNNTNNSNSNNSSSNETCSSSNMLPTGRHTWPFTILLPTDRHLPNSLESQRNQVYYVIRAFVGRVRNGTITAETDLRIRDPIIIDREPYSLPAVLRCPFHVTTAASWLARSAAADAIPSFASLKALVRNTPKALFDRIRSSNIPTSPSVTAVATLNSPASSSATSLTLPESSSITQHQTITTTTTPSNNNGDDDGVYASLSLARTGYRAGERIRMMIGLSGVEVAGGPIGVKARLRRICVHRSNNLVDVENIVVAGGQRPLAESSGVFELQLPRRMLSTSNAPGNQLNGMDGPGCVTVRYTLEVTLRYCVGPAILPRPVAKFRVPLVIGMFAPASSSSLEAAAALARQRRWAAWWRMLALGDDPASAQMYSHALALGIGNNSDGPSMADWELADELNAVNGATSSSDGLGLLPVYEPPPPNYQDIGRLNTEQWPGSSVSLASSAHSDNTNCEADVMLVGPRCSMPPTYDAIMQTARYNRH